MSPVFVISPDFLAKIPIELSEVVIVIGALLLNVFPVASVYIPTFDSPPVIVRAPFTPPLGFASASKFTNPSLTKTKLLLFPLVEVKLKFLRLNIFVLLFSKYAAVDF